METQKKTYRKEMENGDIIRATVTFGDDCGNGHETLSITGELFDRDYIRGEAYAVNSAEKRRYLGSGGQITEDIEKHFPELRAALPFHLVSTDGPMHYVANTVYHAGDRDYNGLRAGETRQIKNGKTGELCWELCVVSPEGATAPLYTLKKYHDGECPETAPVLRWVPWVTEGKGKTRDLDAARRCAVWPEATDAELSQDKEELTAALVARLPEVMNRFREVLTDLGFDLSGVEFCNK